MTYTETLDFLYSRLPVFSRVGLAAYKKDLTNTVQLCNFLDNPQNKIKTIHIAGTNGKGSVSHMLSSIMQEAGYKTGLYTSPHLKDFRERIKINGEPVSEEFVIKFTETVKSQFDKIEPSFFELTVAMAFDWFEKNKVDIAIIETGLGGRLDSTNVITPELSVITNIGWDHMQILGDTLEKIATEKAGIIKPGIPVIIGESSEITDTVFEKIAEQKGSPISFASLKRTVLSWIWEKHELIVEVAEGEKPDHKKFHLDLTGIYQVKNLVTVLECCSVLHDKGWKINEPITRKGLQHVKQLTGLHGRWEIIHQDPLVVLDVAHNKDGMRQVVQQLEVTDHKNLHIIIGLVKDKEIDEILSQLPDTAAYYFTQAQIPRALEAGLLKEKASRFNLHGDHYSEVNLALKNALLKADKDDLVLVCGSLFLVGEVNLGD